MKVKAKLLFAYVVSDDLDLQTKQLCIASTRVLFDPLGTSECTCSFAKHECKLNKPRSVALDWQISKEGFVNSARNFSSLIH
jgi:hypothetical protein